MASSEAFKSFTLSSMVFQLRKHAQVDLLLVSGSPPCLLSVVMVAGMHCLFTATAANKAARPVTAIRHYYPLRKWITHALANDPLGRVRPTSLVAYFIRLARHVRHRSVFDDLDHCAVRWSAKCCVTIQSQDVDTPLWSVRAGLVVVLAGAAPGCGGDRSARSPGMPRTAVAVPGGLPPEGRGEKLPPRNGESPG